jgi:hypothetical protein
MIGIAIDVNHKFTTQAQVNNPKRILNTRKYATEMIIIQ